MAAAAIRKQNFERLGLMVSIPIPHHEPFIYLWASQVEEIHQEGDIYLQAAINEDWAAVFKKNWEECPDQRVGFLPGAKRGYGNVFVCDSSWPEKPKPDPQVSPIVIKHNEPFIYAWPEDCRHAIEQIEKDPKWAIYFPESWAVDYKKIWNNPASYVLGAEQAIASFLPEDKRDEGWPSYELPPEILKKKVLAHANESSKTFSGWGAW